MRTKSEQTREGTMATTLGEAWQQGWRVTVRCALGRKDGFRSIRECTYRTDLDVATLAWTRGRDFPLERLESRMMCPLCGSRRVAVLFQPPGAPNEAARRILEERHWARDLIRQRRRERS